ncbi:MAG: type II toxin-antitoxin system RelE/ParE family toxin [Proteobacteria bacterium]|nr:type II toxin-antitoxin system RelE/ParE family toxin [Pseudomonadota bacterium]
MRRVGFGPDAAQDLADILEWIETQASAAVAGSYVERLVSYCERLSHFPERGASRDDLRPGLRLLGFERRATIAFTVVEDSVLIVRVFYGGRDIEAAFGGAEHDD